VYFSLEELPLIVSSTIYLDRIDLERERYRIAGTSGTSVIPCVQTRTKGLPNKAIKSQVAGKCPNFHKLSYGFT